MPKNQFEKLNEQNYVDWCYMMEGRPTSTDKSKAVRTFVKKQQVAQAKIILHIDEQCLHVLGD
jgi:hypothetical protein